jgi:hypothetical protein
MMVSSPLVNDTWGATAGICSNESGVAGPGGGTGNWGTGIAGGRLVFLAGDGFCAPKPSIGISKPANKMDNETNLAGVRSIKKSNGTIKFYTPCHRGRRTSEGRPVKLE